MAIEKLVRNLGFALAAPFRRARLERDLRISARHQRSGTLNTCPRKETAFMSAHTCLSAASSSSCDARAVMRASNVAVRPMSSSTSTASPDVGRHRDHARRDRVAHRKPRGAGWWRR